MNEKLKMKLVSMKDKDLEMTSSIHTEVGLYEGYPEEMEALHINNAEELKKIVDECG